MITEQDIRSLGFVGSLVTDDKTIWFDKGTTELNWNPGFPKWVEIDCDDAPFGQFRGEIESKEELEMILRMIKV